MRKPLKMAGTTMTGLLPSRTVNRPTYKIRSRIAAT
jgi:hypothetical protein